jgi:cytochrome oxidase Cu insertion factor (SCO1/SenC/PrrC family)
MLRSFSFSEVVLALAVALLLVAPLARVKEAAAEEAPKVAQGPDGRMPHSADPRPGKLRGVIPDVELVDQDGRKVRFYKDAIEGRKFALNFAFTSCQRVCPVQGHLFAELRRKLPADVELLSISLDPEHDTPEKLKAWRARMSGGGDARRTAAGWSLFTGKPEDVNQIVAALTGDVARPQGHTAILFAGDDTRGILARSNGAAAPSVALDAIQRSLAPR